MSGSFLIGYGVQVDRSLWSEVFQVWLDRQSLDDTFVCNERIIMCVVATTSKVEAETYGLLHLVGDFSVSLRDPSGAIPQSALDVVVARWEHFCSAALSAGFALPAGSWLFEQIVEG